MEHIIKKIVLFITFIACINLNAQLYKVDRFSSEVSVIENQIKFNNNQFSKIDYINSLADYLPKTGINHTEAVLVSGSKELLATTIIKKNITLNYYQGDKQVSSVIATETEGGIYNHFKAICNRFNGVSLDSVNTILIKEHKLIKTKISSVSGETEYTLSFSINTHRKEHELFSFWNIDQYPTGNYQNYFIWGSSFAQVYSIANYIIEQHTEKNNLKSTLVTKVLPNVFVKNGTYSNGIVHLNLVNRTQEKSVNFVGNIAETEISEHVKVANTFSLSGGYNEVLSIQTGVLFDIGFYLETSSSTQKDDLYLAGGTWGLDYLKEYVMVSNFEVHTFERELKEDVYEVERSVKAVGEVKGNVNLFRHLLPENKTLNVDKYDFLNFNIKNNEPIEIIIMSNGDRDWKNRLRYTIPANLEEKFYSISFLDFVDGRGNKAVIKDIKTIVFSIIGDYTNYKPFNFDINKIAFTVNNDLSTDDFTSEKNNNLINYPNPFTNFTTIQLPFTSNSILIQVYDIMGRVVDVQNISTNSSSIKVKYIAPQLKKGVYKYRLIDDKKNQHFGTFIVN
ncbi:hypothetical protein BTO15_16770 [Polaribacter sejongensis]|uniref:Secretion system C-terminal sorting domain-containing protein n=1 Tax=Polaribacter sejongensis TaxID=985043 RepID=A0ABN5F9E9_9FLAO|nr:T9SS type A sorting domain-containing protein [Polaribacter sejongensis]AUC23645.1 hypothetical protein BTO15_16770 [Polaribacter sejongensis]